MNINNLRDLKNLCKTYMPPKKKVVPKEKSLELEEVCSKSSAEKSNVEKSNTEKSSTEGSSTGGSDTTEEKPATKKPVTKTPATKTPATKKPATKTPATKTPATKTPATKTPASKTPATKTPVTKTPASKTPASKTPATKTPAEKTPVVKTPVAKTPATKTPPPPTESKEDQRVFALVFDSIRSSVFSALSEKEILDLEKLELKYPSKTPNQAAKTAFLRMCKLTSPEDTGSYIFEVQEVTDSLPENKRKNFLYHGVRTKEPGQKEGEFVFKTVVKSYKPEVKESSAEKKAEPEPIKELVVSKKEAPKNKETLVLDKKSEPEKVVKPPAPKKNVKKDVLQSQSTKAPPPKSKK